MSIVTLSTLPPEILLHHLLPLLPPPALYTLSLTSRSLYHLIGPTPLTHLSRFLTHRLIALSDPHRYHRVCGTCSALRSFWHFPSSPPFISTRPGVDHCLDCWGRAAPRHVEWWFGIKFASLRIGGIGRKRRRVEEMREELEMELRENETVETFLAQIKVKGRKRRRERERERGEIMFVECFGGDGCGEDQIGRKTEGGECQHPGEQRVKVPCEEVRRRLDELERALPVRWLAGKTGDWGVTRWEEAEKWILGEVERFRLKEGGEKEAGVVDGSKGKEVGCKVKVLTEWKCVMGTNGWSVNVTPIKGLNFGGDSG